ncbi:MAG: hypothetical protein HRT89_18915, partial [Lentisphaeria bacterium]|nr:hypothetical protein [Lentisphaeria bacterium]
MSESESAIPDEILMAPFLILAAVRNTRKMFSPEDAKKKLVEFTKTFEAGCKQATVKTILAQVLSGADKLMANAFAADTEIDANTLIVTIKTQVTTKMVTEASNVYLLYLLELSECLTHETNLMGNTRIVEESAEFYGVVVKNLAVMAAPELPPMEEELTIKEVAKTKPAKSKGHMLKIIVVFIVLGIFLAIAAVIAGVVGFNKTKEFNFIKLVKDGDYTKLKYGLMFHPDRINKADSKSNELIHLAVKSENEEIVALLIANGA